MQSGNGEAVSSVEKQSCSVEVNKLGLRRITECGLKNPVHLLSPVLFSFALAVTIMVDLGMFAFDVTQWEVWVKYSNPVTCA